MSECVCGFIDAAQSSGNSGSISEEQFSESEIGEALAALVDETYQTAGGEYPLIARGRDAKRFRASFADFWDKLVERCRDGLLFDEYLVPTLVAWLTGISSSSIRPFRHTATLAGLQIVSALTRVCARLREDIESGERQAAAESRKARGGREAALQEQLAAQREQLASVEGSMEEVFNGIFMHRFRDVFPDIRAACLEALGRWIETYPAVYRADQYLKYLGWHLYDRAPEVRLASLRVLLALYSNPDHVPSLYLFTQRFKARLLECMRDRDPGVAAVAIRLASRLAELDVLEDEEEDSIYAFATDESSVLREATAEFVRSRLLEREKTPAAQLSALLDFIVNRTRLPAMPVYVVDALWGRCDALRNWKAMVDLLQDEEALQEPQRAALVGVLNAAVRRAAGFELCPHDPRPGRRAAAAAEKLSVAQVQQARAEYTRQLARALPALLEAFQDQEERLEELVELVPLLELEQFRASRREAQFKELLRLLHEAFLRHTRDSLLRLIARAFRHLVQAEHSLAVEADVAVRQLADDLQERLRAARRPLDSKRGAADDAALYSLQLLLQRLVALFLSLDLSRNDLYSAARSLFDARERLGSRREGIVAQLVRLMAQQALWEVAALGESEAPSPARLEAVAQLRDELFDRLLHALREGRREEGLRMRETALLVTADLLVLFSPNLRGTSLERLAYDAPADLQAALLAVHEETLARRREEPDEEAQEAQERSTLALSRLVAYNCLDPGHAPTLLLALSGCPRPVEAALRSLVAHIRASPKFRDSDIFLQTLQLQFNRSSSAAQKKDKEKGKKRREEEEEEQEKEKEEEEHEESASAGKYAQLRDLATKLAYAPLPPSSLPRLSRPVPFSTRLFGTCAGRRTRSATGRRCERVCGRCCGAGSRSGWRRSRATRSSRQLWCRSCSG